MGRSCQGFYPHLAYKISQRVIKKKSIKIKKSIFNEKKKKSLIFVSRCWSFVGKFGGSQLLSLQPPDENGPNCLGDEGRAIHELMHALGVFHEQSRADRDTFVKIHPQNILPSKKKKHFLFKKKELFISTGFQNAKKKIFYRFPG